MRRRDLQRLTDPLTGGESAPAVRRPGRWMWPSIDEDRPIERAHELQAIADNLPRDGIEIFQNACTTNAAPLVWRRVRPALIFRRAPDRFGCRVGAKTSGFVE